MVDMSQFIAAKSDQLNADDLMDTPRTITITKVTASPDAAEQPVSIHYEGGEGRPWKPCKTMRRILVGVWGKDATKYVGRSLTLYRDPTVAFGGLQVGGIRVSHMSHIDGEKTVAVMVTRGRKAPFKVLPLRIEQPTPASDDAATKWADAYIAKLTTFATADALQTFADQKARKLRELENARPDLHEKVTTALAARKEELSRPPSAFDDDLADDTHPAQPKADELKALIANAPTEDEVSAVIRDNQADILAMPPEIGASVEIAADKRKAEIRAEREAAKEGAA